MVSVDPSFSLMTKLKLSVTVAALADLEKDQIMDYEWNEHVTL